MSKKSLERFYLHRNYAVWITFTVAFGTWLIISFHMPDFPGRPFVLGAVITTALYAISSSMIDIFLYDYDGIEQPAIWAGLIIVCAVCGAIGYVFFGMEAVYFAGEILLMAFVISLCMAAIIAYARRVTRAPQTLASAIGDTPLDSPNLTTDRIKRVLKYFSSKGGARSCGIADRALNQFTVLAEYRRLLSDVGSLNGDNVEISKAYLVIDDTEQALRENARIVANYCLLADSNEQARKTAADRLDQSKTLINDVGALVYDVLQYSAVDRKNDPSSDFIEEVNRLRELANQILDGSRGDRPVLLSDIYPEAKEE